MSGHAPERPGILGYILAGCLPALTAVIGMTIFVVVIMTGMTELGRLEGADGTVTLHVREPGDYYCFAEGINFTPAQGNFAGLTLTATDTPGGPMVVSPPGGQITYTLAPRQGVAIRSIHFPEAGAYTVKTEWAGEPPGTTQVTRLVFADYNIVGAALSMLGGCCGTAVAMVVAIILAVVTYKRRAAWDLQHAPPPTATFEPGPGEWSAPPADTGDPPDPYRRPLDDPPPPDEERLY